MQRRTIAPIFFVGLILLAGCLSTPLQTTADGGVGGINAANTMAVSTTGTSEVTVGADLAVVSIAVTTTADSADEARGTVADDMAAVRTAPIDAGIAGDTVRTTGFSIYPEYDYSGQERELLGYRTAHTLRIKVAPDHAGEVIDLAVSVGASEIRDVAFTLANEKRAELRRETLTHAVDPAKADADSAASAADLTVTNIHTAIVGGSASPKPYPIAYAEDAARASFGSTELSPSPMTVSTTVQMVCEVESG